VVCRSLLYVVVVVVESSSSGSTRDPPYEQLLVGMGAGVASIRRRGALEVVLACLLVVGH
jgi:hypothetical protein